MKPNSNLDKIYAEFGKDICLFPFVAGFYSLASKNPVVMPCSIIKTEKWDIDGNSLIESMNSKQWQDLRHNFIQGSCHTSKFCETCSVAEKNGGDSPRQLNNYYFAEHISTDLVPQINLIIGNDYKIDRILSLDFCPSNYCNYECIMCFPSASSKRGTFEIKFFGADIDRKFNNTVTDDFYNILEHVEILNFTGGETLMQKQVHELIDYLIEHNLAKNMIISLLTNVSKYPESLQEKFKQFKDVFYTLSIDGIGDVIEYQRRGAVWQDVEANSIRLQKELGCVVNYVLTAVNVFSFDQFVNWVHKHNMDRVIISLVYERNKNLSVSIIPPELKTPLIEKLQLARNNYTNERYVKLFDQVIDILVTANYNETLLPKFVGQIQIEDQVSKKKLVEVVPEWKPYFE
jgi:MoaA/NifB/PqqE/SkfB family radical SAM enzyme